MQTRMRIMGVNLTPKQKLPRAFTTLNPLDKGTHLVLSGGDLTASGNNSSFVSMVRVVLPMDGGQHYWETEHIFDGGSDCAAGVKSDIDNVLDISGSSHFGQGGEMAAYDKNGDFWVNNIKVYDGAPLTSGDIVRHWFDADAGIYLAAVNGGSFVSVSVDLPNTYKRWFVCLAVKGLGSQITANFGATAFAYAVPPGVRKGVYSDPLADYPIYASSAKLTTGKDNVPAFTCYDPRISSDNDVEITRSMSCWPQGGQTEASRGQLVLILTDGLVDIWADLVWRDAPVTILKGYEGDDFADFTVWQEAKVESDQRNDYKLFLTLTDELAGLDKAVQTDLYPDDQPNDQIVHTVKPVCLGRPWYCEGKLLTTAETGGDEFSFDVSGTEALDSIPEIYDGGDIFDPMDWVYIETPVRHGFQLLNKPFKKIVCNPIGIKNSLGGVIEYLTDWARYLFVTRAALDESKVDFDAFDNLQTATKILYRMADFVIQSRPIIDLVRDMANCFCAGVFTNRLGKITIARFETPSAVYALRLDSTNIIGVPREYPDLAPGLTTVMSGAKNNAPHSDTDISTTATTALRERLKAEYLIVRSALPSLLTSTERSNVVSRQVSQADAAGSFKTILQDAEAIQMEISRVATIWREPARLWDISAIMDNDQADLIEPGDTVFVVYDRFGLDAGRSMIVKKITNLFFSNIVKFTLFDPATEPAPITEIAPQYLLLEDLDGILYESNDVLILEE